MKEKFSDRNSDAGSGRLPLVFGVSGHRDLLLADVPQLRDQLSQLFASFRAAYPHTPFRLLTPLAEGADRLAAEVALASQINLVVPLPMKRQEYERDFTTPESLAEFRSFFAKAEFRWEVTIAPNARAQTRTQQYAEVGDFIARYSHILILLWDGRDNRKIGGTAWVKKRREHWVKAASDPSGGIGWLAYGPTIQVVTPRASGRLPQPRPATIGQLPPSAREFAVTLAKRQTYGRGKNKARPPLSQLVYWALDTFNASVASASPVRRRKKRQSTTRSRL